MGPQRGLLVECSGLGGAPSLTQFREICSSSVCRLPRSTDRLWPTWMCMNMTGRGGTSHLLAALLRFMIFICSRLRPGQKKFAWDRIISLMHLPEVQEAKASKIMTQAGVLAAIGKKLPAHLRDPHPGFALGLRLILGCLLPVPLRTYLTDVSSPVVALEAGWLMASAAPPIRDATRELHVLPGR